MTLSEELKWRGFINQTTIKDLSVLDRTKRTFYIGFDASADSQTVGNLAAIMFAKTFIRHGYKAVILAGGSTSLIGDPGGKTEERKLQDENAIAKNVRNAEQQIRKIMTGYEYKLVNNLDWTKDLKVLPFLRDIGKHFSMTPLVQRDYIAKRIGKEGTGISYAEFSYTILQGYDYLHLFDKYNVTLQLGGSDQWGNCLSGVELVRKVRGAEVDAITLKLIINKATGQKFGKSEGGAIWLDETKTNPNDFYQFWVNIDDNSVSEYLKIFTELEREEISSIMKEFERNKAERSAQQKLAYEVTKLVHGKTIADKAQEHAMTISGKSNLLSSAEVEPGADIVDLLVTHNLASSRTEAKRLLQSGGVYVNNMQTTKPTLQPEDFVKGLVILRRGKSKSNTVILKQK